MSGRYLCIVGTAGASAQEEHQIPADFRMILNTDRLRLLLNEDAAFEQAEGEGYGIIGRSFAKGSGVGPFSTAKTLLASRWGMYVGLRTGSGGEVRVARDPSGQLPCYYRQDGRRWIIASDIDLLRFFGAHASGIEWEEVSDALTFLNHFSARTALVGIQELLPGEELVITDDRICTHMVWSPWDHATTPIQSLPQAVEQLRDAFELVHANLAAAFPRPLILLSGGLDSSIVATEIARHIKGADHLNFYTPADRFGDERKFARLVAQACDASLSEVALQSPDFSVSLRAEMFLPRPTIRTIAGLMNTRIADQAYLGGQQVILGGFGGDNIFGANASAYALSDLLRAGGSPRDIRATLGDLRRVTGASHGALARHVAQTLMRHFRPSAVFRWARDCEFLSPQAASRQLPARPHPWLTMPSGAMRGSMAHIAALISAHNFFERVPRTVTASHIWPLLLTPIVEVCLSIPSWLWCSGGSDRSVARMAATDLPEEIVRRKSKGSPTHLSARYFETHQTAIGNFLCEGMLCDRGIIDPDAVRIYCERPPPVRDLGFLRILELVDAEIWCRYQSGQRSIM